jgi:hypothetical protein
LATDEGSVSVLEPSIEINTSLLPTAQASSLSPSDVFGEAIENLIPQKPQEPIIPAKTQRNFSNQVALTINVALGTWFGFLGLLIVSLLLLFLRRGL